MIYKVFYQESMKEYPIRERTKSLFLEADSERDVRLKLSDRHYNIELIQQVNEDHLTFEQKSTDFEVERV